MNEIETAVTNDNTNNSKDDNEDVSESSKSQSQIHIPTQNAHNETSNNEGEDSTMSSELDSTPTSSSSCGIQVFLRIRPSTKTKTHNNHYYSFERDDIEPHKKLKFHRNSVGEKENNSNASSLDTIARHPSYDEVINNAKKIQFGFQFSHIFDMEDKQDDIFSRVGKPAVENALAGFNSTVFAYGQTGSGKTFTITGGPERYVDRGIIPRSITMLFKEFEKRSSGTFSAYVSYLEIYNDSGYDLLADNSTGTSADTTGTTSSTRLPRVIMREDEDGNFHFKNLSVHPISSEEDALNYLFLGDTNRAIAETEMNEASSRSHCIFTIMIEQSTHHGDSEGEEGLVLKSKLNLVDLAGSERVKRTNSSGQILKEAKYINSSLFYLEMVILALYEKEKKSHHQSQKKFHVPYRNSMMTSVLRDSLGGNCKTIMIATISPDTQQTDESISTCHFAQRVALIQNKAKVNEELDPKITIQRLKNELEKLRHEVKFLKRMNQDTTNSNDEDEGEEDEQISSTENKRLISLVQDYIDNPRSTSELNIGKITLTKINHVYKIFKDTAIKLKTKSRIKEDDDGGHSENPSLNDSHHNNMHNIVSSLKKTLRQREQEIQILVNMVKQLKRGKAEGNSSSALILGMDKSASNNNNNNNLPEEKKKRPELKKEVGGVELLFCTPDNSTLLEDPSKAFEWFQQRYHSGNKAMQENKDILREKYKEAKEISQQIQKSRSQINYFKNTIEQIRREESQYNNDDINYDNNDRLTTKMSQEETKYRVSIEKEKNSYKKYFHQLKELKTTIEHIQKLMERNTIKMQQDFELWLKESIRQNKTNVGGVVSSGSCNGINSMKTSSEAIDVGEAKNSDKIHSCSSTSGTEQKRYSTSTISSSSSDTDNNNSNVGNNDNNNNKKTTPLHSPSLSSSSSSLPKGIQLTGNKDTDNDIIAFFKAKEALMVSRQQR